MSLSEHYRSLQDEMHITLHEYADGKTIRVASIFILQMEFLPTCLYLWTPMDSTPKLKIHSGIPHLISTSVCEFCYLKMGIDATQPKFSLWLFHIATIQYFSSWQDKWNRNSSLKTFPFYKHEFVYLFSRNPQNIRKVLPLRLYRSIAFDWIWLWVFQSY